MSLLTVKNLTAGYGKAPILDSISFDASPGQLIGILGANGSGKTTLLKAICGILPHRGSCTLENVSLEKLSPRQLARLCSYIPQRSGISIDIPLVDVVLMGFNPRLGLLARPTDAMVNTAYRVLSQVGLAGREQESFLNLSEGQKQLCILARTLVSQSRLLLLDEPESALDFHYRYEMLSHLKNWVSAEKRAAVVALHDPALALNQCDRLILLAGGQILGILTPATDSLEKMEPMLCTLYGSISLQRCQNRSGHSCIVMLKEDTP